MAYCRNWQNTSTGACGRDNNGARLVGSSAALSCSRPGRAPPRMHHRLIPAWGAALLAMLCALAAAPGDAAPAAMETPDQSVCRTIERSAQMVHLPVEFVTRVIWRESSFRP